MSKKKVKFEYQANQERDHMLWNKITSGRQNALFKRTAASKAQKNYWPQRSHEYRLPKVRTEQLKRCVTYQWLSNLGRFLFVRSERPERTGSGQFLKKENSKARAYIFPATTLRISVLCLTGADQSGQNLVEPARPVSQGFRPPQGFASPRARSLGISPPLGIVPPLKFRDFASPPPPRFRSSYFLYIIGVKNNGKKIGHFDTCTNYSRCSQWNSIITCKRCVHGSARRYFHFCENLLVFSSSLNYYLLKTN